MRSDHVKNAVAIWASAYLGCIALALGELAWRGADLSVAFLAQLLWLALLGSVPTTVVLAGACWTWTQGRFLRAGSAIVVVFLVALIAWSHTDFLLSSPHWITHPHRGALRIGMVTVAGFGAAAGWGWLWLGCSTQGRLSKRAIWLTVTTLAVVVCAFVFVRYRAYDYSTAQLVFPAGVLCAAMLHVMVRDWRYRPVIVAAATTCLLFAVGSRFDPTLVATGQREVVAHSRAGVLATLYLLPQMKREAAQSVPGSCPEVFARIEEAPIGIPPQARRNVILISVDALRKDVVGSEANGRPITPSLSRFAARGISFENATTSYPATLFAIGSAFTGLSPAELYVSAGLPETIFTRSRGYVDRQIAVFPDDRWFGLPIVAEFLASGIAVDFAPTDAAGTNVFIRRLRNARAEDASVLAWIHYYAPHDPYRAHPRLRMGRGKKSDYLSEVAYFDRELGRLMRYLDEDGWLGDTLVVFFSDHGEALGEKSYWGHHVYLNGWMIDVPLVLWHADLAPSRPSAGVGLADIAPTVLHFLGLPIPSDIAAQSLFTVEHDRTDRATFAEAFPVRNIQLFESFRMNALDDASIQERLRGIHVLSKGYEPKIAITQGRYRLVHHRNAHASLFFDRQQDPLEETDISSEEPEAARMLQANLEQWERDQLRRIQCRLNLGVDRPAIPNPE